VNGAAPPILPHRDNLFGGVGGDGGGGGMVVGEGRLLQRHLCGSRCNFGMK
jgi:hypothetical protein